jgi:F-type H+-transporting ATPase subunit b
MLLSIDGTFFVQILNFVAFWVLLNFLFIVPTRRSIEERQRMIAGQYAESQASRKRAADLQAQADSILDLARRRTEELLRDAAAQAAEQSHGIERQATLAAASSVQLAHATVASERALAVAKQAPFVAELAKAMAARATEVESVT